MVSNKITATTQLLRRRSTVTGLLAVIAAVATLGAAFLQTSFHWPTIAITLGMSLLAAVVATILQLSKSGFEHNRITSAVTTDHPVRITSGAALAIGGLDTDAKIDVLAFLHRLSANPAETMNASERAETFPHIVSTLLNNKYRIAWMTTGSPPETITILSLSPNRQEAGVS